MLTDTSETVRLTILRSLARKRGKENDNFRDVDDECDILGLGLIDSEDLVDLILEVEEQCKCEFNAEAIDTADGLTVKTLIGAFAAKT
jgi:acyl carrier protein